MIKDVNPQKLIEAAAEKLKGMEELKPPEWSNFVKTGTHKERVPTQKDWWHIRTASVLRKLYMEQGLGVSSLRKVYGGRKNKGHKPEHKYKASGAIIRKALQQLESVGFAKTEKGKGRFITPEGQKFLNGIAKELKKVQA